MRFSIEVEYEIGDNVYCKTDMEQSTGLVLGYRITNLGVEYIVSLNSETMIFNPLELSPIKTIY
ncbi:hypothetical protein [Empedobacter sp. GD03739]|uniref:hypothetical protein n=1 Tax=Empedobacter sp. GD03739 TaxID=2975376 RepID=UPI002449D023|nr:hypothetical protein [Empedobacter sp. GD03739]MDH1602352.1 hypothetical protein [Empedobacter sp. GD03739]